MILLLLVFDGLRFKRPFFLCSEERLAMKFALKKEAVRVLIVRYHLLCRVCHPFTNLSWNKDPLLSNKGLLYIFHWRHPTFDSSPGSFQNVCHTMLSWSISGRLCWHNTIWRTVWQSVRRKLPSLTVLALLKTESTKQRQLCFHFGSLFVDFNPDLQWY